MEPPQPPKGEVAFKEKYNKDGSFYIFWCSVANGDDGEMDIPWTLAEADKLIERIRDLNLNTADNQEFVDCIRTQLFRLECLNAIFSFGNHPRGIIVPPSAGGAWTLRLHESWIILMEWIAILFNFKEIINLRDDVMKIIQGDLKRLKVWENLLLTNDFKAWSSKVRNPTYHGNSVSIDFNTYMITFTQTGHDPWKIQYRTLYNQCRRLTLLLYVVFLQFK